jgi:DNA-directed RNA polymerase subunit RPC12/RpoP
LNLKTEFEAEGHVVEIRQGDFVTNTNPAPQFGAPMTARKKTAGGSGYVPETKAEIYAAEMYGIDFGGRDGETEDETNFIENYANMVADGSEPSTSDIDDLASNFPTLRRRASKKKAGLYSPSENFKCMDCGTDEDQFQLMDEDEAEWSDVQCPKCNAVYSPGFSEYEEDYDGVEHLAKKKYKRNTSALYGNNELWL